MLKYREVLKMMKKLGFQLDRINGSHHIFKRENNTLSVALHKSKGIHRNIILRDIKKFC